MPIIDKEIEGLLAKIQENAVEQSDIIRLMEIGRSYGFQTINNRKKIWPVLLEVNIQKLQQSADFLDWRKNPAEHSEDYDLLKKDAMRSFYSFNVYKEMDRHYLKKKQQDLLEILDAFAKNQPRYRYFQGFHDVVSVFIGIFGSNIGYYMSHRIATTYLRDSFLYTFEETVSILDKLIYFITVKTDPEFENIFAEFVNHKLAFTMAWIITWFAHSFEDINVVTRIWDYMISSQASAIVYISAALILQSKQQLIDYCDASESGYDIGIIHMFFQNLNDKKIDIEKVIKRAITLEEAINIQTIGDTDTLPQKTVMKEENFVKLIRSHTIFKQNKIRKEKTKKIVRTVVAVGAIVAFGAWTYSVFGKKPPIHPEAYLKGL